MPIKPQISSRPSAGPLAAYIADEEAACQAAQVAVAAAAAPGPPLNLWALAGRQQTMQMRLLCSAAA